MPRYAITETAGRFVAGTNNTGVGTVLTLTEKQAEHEVRLGTLRLLDGANPEPKDVTEPSSALPIEDEPDKAPPQTPTKDAKK
jgi:hypothetical protein